ncbi:MAG: hypothetical protein AAF458_00550 [Pseudomonadota bacterium]
MTRIRTTAVGSWPIPFGQRLTLKQFYAGDLDESRAFDALTRAARVAMDEQLACGLDQISGGEVFAPDFLHHIPPRLHGLGALALRDTAQGYDGVGRYTVEGPLTAPRGTGHASAYRRERALEPTLDKATVPSPFTITMAFDGTVDRALHREALTAIVAAEVEDMVIAGAEEVQLDAPVEAIEAIRTASGTGQYSVAELAEWVSGPLESVPPEIRRSVHFCLGDISRQPATEVQNLAALLPLIQALDGKVDRLLVECSYVGQWRDRALLTEIPHTMEIVAGIADVKSRPESVEALRGRVGVLADLLGPQRLLLSTSCGCGRMPHDDAIRLNRNLVKAAGGE